MKFAHCLRAVFVIGKYTDIFCGKGGNFCLWRFSSENFQLRWKFPGLNFPGKILHWENLPELLLKILFISLTLPLPTHFDM